MPEPRTINDWIARDAVAFDLATADDAIDRGIAALGDGVDLLGLGEMMHGSEEVLLLRNRWLARLVAAHGFTAIAFESSFPRGRLVDDFVRGRGPESYDAIRESGFSHRFGALDANRALVEWVRTHNARASTPVCFHGFDSPTEMGPSDSPRRLLEVALEALGAVDATLAGTFRERIEPLLGVDAEWENPAAAFDPAKSVGLSPAATALRVATEDLIAALDLRRPDFADGESYAEAERYAAHARQMLTYHAMLATPSADRLSRLLGLRDVMMADNLAYIVAREQWRGGRVLAFAHNSHLTRGRARWQMGPNAVEWWPAGAHLAAALGPRYAVIGSGVGTSPENGVAAPEAGTIEERLLDSPGPMRLIPTRGARTLAVPTAARSGGAKNPTYFPLTATCTTDFDALLVLDTTTYNRGGPQLPTA